MEHDVNDSVLPENPTWVAADDTDDNPEEMAEPELPEFDNHPGAS